jgi:hypothetical protein
MMAKNPKARVQKQPRASQKRPKITEKEMTEILKRARETVKPLINREAANEVVGEDILNFRMNCWGPGRW